MKSWIALIALCAGAQSTLTAPDWLTAYPGTLPNTRTLPSLIESSYQTKAGPTAVLAHYEKLFEGAGLTFAPTFDGMGTVVKAAPPECDLLIKVREQDGGSFVRVSCAVKTPAMVAVPTPPPTPKSVAPVRGPEPDRMSRAEEAARNRILEMQKYDEPVQYHPRTAPTWPVWLVDPQGGRLPVRKTSADSTFLSSSFSVAGDLAAVNVFYADLAESRGCRVSGRGKAWLEASCKLDPRSDKVLIVRAELSPIAGGTQVQMRVSSIP
jgi:hypothetical protein